MTAAAAETGKEEDRKGKDTGVCVCLYARVCVYIHAFKCMCGYTISLYIKSYIIHKERECYRHNSVLLREKNHRNVTWMLLSHQVFSVSY